MNCTLIIEQWSDEGIEGGTDSFRAIFFFFFFCFSSSSSLFRQRYFAI
jgi:hypothetical protein